jgi:hypothetical protein
MKLGEIIHSYLQSEFPLHFCCIALILIDVISDGEWIYMKYIRMVNLFRLCGLLEKLEKLENYFINSVYK